MTTARRPTVKPLQAKLGIKVWPGPCKVKDRTLIDQFTVEDAYDFGGFPVNSLDFMVQDPSVNTSWKNVAGGLYDTFNKCKPCHRSMGGFMTDIQSSFEKS